MILNKNMSFALFGSVGLAFIGYCFYFDHKRRNHPDFRKKLIEKRKKQKLERDAKDSIKYPDLSDDIAVQKFFMTEIQLGETLMGTGDIENGIEHLANAVAVTSHKENLLNVLRTTLPDQIFRMLVEKLPEVSQKIYNSYKAKSSNSSKNNEKETNILESKIIEITEDNLAVDECLD